MMLRIGEFSKLSMLTIKTLRFYEKEGLLKPASVDEWTGYRMYDTAQLETAAKIKALRQLDFTVEEIKAHFHGKPLKAALQAKAQEIEERQTELGIKLSILNFLLEEKQMKYQAVIKEVPECIVYSEERRLAHYADLMSFVPESGAECKRLNPNLKCAEPSYEFCEYLDGEYQENDVLIRHSEAVTEFGVGNERIKFRSLPAAKVISIYHKGAYEQIGEAYAYIMKYAEENGYKIAGLSRECYIDGIWNKESVDDWLTEIQLPVK